MGLNVPRQNVPYGEHQKGETALFSSVNLCIEDLAVESDVDSIYARHTD
jgi:hypothetical protein